MFQTIMDLADKLPWWVWSLVSNFAIIRTEFINRNMPGGFPAALPDTWYLIVTAQCALYYAFNGAPNWMSAWALFTICNAMLRTAAVGATAGHEIASWTFVLAGILGMLGFSYVLKLGLK